MSIFAEPALAPSRTPFTIRGPLVESSRLYRTNFTTFTSAFLLPALARFAWTITERAITHHRHPDWPQAGISVNAEWGLNLYWSTIALSCAGLLLYFVLAGPAIAKITRIVVKMTQGENGNVHHRSNGVLLRSLPVQLLCAIRAGGVFAAGLLATILVGATLLPADPGSGLPAWYLLVAITFLVGVPLGVWLTLCDSLAVPAAAIEHLRPKSSLERSRQLTKGIKTRLLLLVVFLLSVRWILGVAGAWSINPLLINPLAATVFTYLVSPLLACILDTLFGSLCGATIAWFYVEKTSAEMLFYAPIS